MLFRSHDEHPVEAERVPDLGGDHEVGHVDRIEGPPVHPDALAHGAEATRCAFTRL